MTRSTRIPSLGNVFRLDLWGEKRELWIRKSNQTPFRNVTWKMRLLAMIGLLSFLFGCSGQPEISAGVLCTVDDGEGFYRVAKVLAIDDAGVHIRLYKNKWKERPKEVDRSTLSLGSIHDKDGFGMGHLPLTKRAFSAWKPVFLSKEEVRKEEMHGYEMWKDSKGGYFGDK
jgi:hypothetical protein